MTIQTPKFAVETWGVGYEPAPDGSQLEPSSADVDPSVELPAGNWRPLTPDPLYVLPQEVAFVDGIRRIDASIVIETDTGVRPGICASVAAGVVTARCHRAAQVVDTQVLRGVFSTSGVHPIETKHGTYQVRTCASDDRESLYLGIHQAMTQLELRCSEDLSVEMIIFDGPLRSREITSGVGYIKAQHVLYLPDECQRVVYNLSAGQRTPVFVVGSGGQNRWSWYVRLPGPITHGLSGTVRCELPGFGTVDDVIPRADVISRVLLRFASEPHKDPRAPQNLYPIAGLERALRRRLGDVQLLQRGLRIAASTTP
ncbi:MAG: hypothetical protein KAZ88_06780 [Acidimicrobiia bacterium]|jgi:hypothetical protein|nr:hypothetical protein [Acidimicrobiia bacterium]MBP8180678.1 hypothetical protein [Acidimicrobiia bacterium]